MTFCHLTPCAADSLGLTAYCQDFLPFFHTGLLMFVDILDPSVPELQWKLWIQLLWFVLLQKQCLIPEYKRKKSICEVLLGRAWVKMKRGKENSKGALCDAWASHQVAVARIISAITGKLPLLVCCLDMIFLTNCLLTASGYSHWSSLCQLWLEKLFLSLAAVTAEAHNSSGAENAVLTPISSYTWMLSS